MLLHVILAFSVLAPPSAAAPRPSKAAAQKAFNDGEWQKALDLYRELANTPGVHAPHALVGAHDSLRALHRTTSSNEHLCGALDLARAVLARDDLADGERAYWLELEADDTKLAGSTCPDASAKPTPTEPVESMPADPQLGNSDKRDAEDATAPVAGPSTPEGPAPAPAVKDTRPRRSVARIVSGSIFSAVGAGLVGGMIGVLVRRGQADETIAGITNTLLAEDRSPTEAEADAVAAARATFKEDGTNAWVLGIVGSVSALTGLAVLLAPARRASPARLRPGAGGFVYSF